MQLKFRGLAQSHLLYGATLFLSASLLFVVQPLVGRLVQPVLGGTPAVWNTAMLFFQAALLAGYLYAHLTTRWVSTQRQSLFHLAVLFAGLVFLPISFDAPPDPTDLDAPALWLLGELTVTVGWPIFVIATSAPLLQRWFADINHRDSGDPYFLYAAGNAGSLLALAAYPLLIEPTFGLSVQSTIWTAAYLGLCGAVALCAAALWRTPPPDEQHVPAAKPPAAAIPLTWRRRAKWLAYAFIPTSLMLSVTTFLTTDIAPMPMLWIPPLAIYLLSFVAAFSRRNPIPHRFWVYAAPMALAISGWLLFMNTADPLGAVATLQLVSLLVLCMVFHGQLAADRPATDQLTEFYLWLAVGGVLGGIFNALVAPVVFDKLLEYPVVLVLSALLLPRQAIRVPHLRMIFGWVTVILTIGLAYVAYDRNQPTEDEIYSARSFFAAHRLTSKADGNFHALMHGRTIHGVQARSQELVEEPLSYYSRNGPLGQIFTELERRKERHPIAAIGLGAGTVAAYPVAEQKLEVFEIDPLVHEIATDPELFSYLDNCRGDCRVSIGDGRLLIDAEEEERFELIVVDAYSSSAVPIHLLTREALAIYAEKLRPDGLLAIHISSPYLDLEPPLARAAQELGLAARVQTHVVGEEDAAFHHYVDSSQWLLIARGDEALGALATDPRWDETTPQEGIEAWTDDYANLLDVFVGAK